MNNSDWEPRFAGWAAGPSETEAQKCSNAESVIRGAIGNHQPLQALKPRVFVQGSYRANTNIGLESDVDICVLVSPPFFPKYPPGVTAAQIGNSPSKLSFAEYKTLVQDALIARFKTGVTRGKKAFDIHENSYRVDADVVPALEYREYLGTKDAEGRHLFRSGIGFDVDGGGRVVNWPEQTYANGVAKNKETGRRYKQAVRILKGLRFLMIEEDVSAASGATSFLLESIAWNVDSGLFQCNALHEDVRGVLVAAYNGLGTDEDAAKWYEVNGIKPLFSKAQPWTRQQAHDFIVAAWQYLEFK